MKIAVNSRLHSYMKGGIPNYIERLYLEFSEMYPSHEVVFFQPNRKKAIGTTRAVGKYSPGQILWLFDLIWVHFLLKKEGDVDIYHGAANILPLFKMKSVIYAVTIHDLAFKLYPRHNKRTFNVYYGLAVWWSVNHADIIVAVSESTKRDIMRFYGVASERINVIPLGANRVNQELAADDPKLGSGNFFLSVTTHPKRKNIPNVLRAFASKLEKFAGMTYVIAGAISDQHSEELLELISELKLDDRVRIIGFVSNEELYRLYRSAEFFIYPSFYEGFGLPLVEAMLSECLVLTSVGSSMPELVRSHRWLFDPNSPQDIAQKMVNIVALDQDQRKKLVERNLEFAKKFTWDNTASITEKLFSSHE
jgi:glycosyltransferase involved in cell wall biosynthesis